MRFAWIAIAFGLGLATVSIAKELEVQTRLEPPGPFHVGDRLTVVWELIHDPAVVIKSDLTQAAFSALSGAGLEPAQGEKPTATLSKGREHGRPLQILSVSVTTFTTGSHRIASIPIRFTDTAGKEQTVSTPGVVVDVATLLKGPKLEPHPIKEPIPYPYTFQLPLWVWIALALLACVAVVLWRRFKTPKFVPPPPPLPPHEEALGRIEELLSAGLIAAGQIKEFCDRLSDILRAYLGRQFGLSSMGETSLELLESLSMGGYLAEEPMSCLEKFLEECDLAKFARHLPAPNDLDGLVQTARTLVETARPKVVPPAPPAPSSSAVPPSAPPEVAS